MTAMNLTPNPAASDLDQTLAALTVAVDRLNTARAGVSGEVPGACGRARPLRGGETVNEPIPYTLPDYDLPVNYWPVTEVE